MIARIRRELCALRDDAPGVRFEHGFDRTRVRNPAIRTGLVSLGFVLMATAAVTFFVPGPNFVLVLAGLALVTGQSRHGARLLDRLELGARRWRRRVWRPYTHKTAVIVLAVLVAAALAAGIAWFLYVREMTPYVQ